MTNEELANELVRRLNDLIKEEDVRDDIDCFMAEEVGVSGPTLQHPTIQVCWDEPDRPRLRFLGLLNGIVGAKGEGLVSAIYGDNGRLIRFERTGLARYTRDEVLEAARDITGKDIRDLDHGSYEISAPSEHVPAEPKADS